MDGVPVVSASQALRRGSGILILAFVLSFFVNMLRLSGLIFMMLVFDRVLPSRSQETLVALFSLLVVMLLAQGVIDYARRRLLARFGAQFQERLETSLLATAKRGDLFGQGRLKPVIGLDEVDGLRSFFHSGSLIAIYDFIWSPAFLVLLFVLNPLLGYLCLGGIGIILTLVMVQMVFIGRRETDAAASSRKIGDLKTMIAASRETIRSQEMSQGFSDRWLTARSGARDNAIALKDWTAWFERLSDMTVSLVRYSVLAIGAWLTIQGAMTIGAVVVAMFLVARALGPIESFLTQLPDMFQARRNWAQLNRILDAKVEGAALPSQEEGSRRARLSLDNVTVRSPLTGATILRGVTFDLPPGQMAQVVGSTGSGKTLLAETIMGLWKHSAGTTLINGLNLARLTGADTERLLGYVPENPGFLAGTLADNIAHLDPEATPERIATAARKACLHAFIGALPDGYQTMIEPSGGTLSRGKRHQLALARALYFVPELLVLDEPDAMLFEAIPETMNKTFDRFLKDGGSVLIVSRKRLALKQIQATYQIEDGRLKLLKAADGTVQPAKVTLVLGDKPPRDQTARAESIIPLARG